MKKTLHYADCLVLLAAIIGCLLQLWFQNAGVDAGGLYRTGHPAWILLCLLSAGTVVFLWLLSRAAGDNRRYEDNFRRSKVSAGSYILLAIVLGYFGITDLVSAEGFLEALVALSCMTAAVMLGVTGVERFSGNRPVVFLHLIPCIYLAMRMFLMGRDLGTEPELCRYLFRFAASLSLIPAMFWLWAFDVNMGNRQRSLFWSLIAAFFCLVSTFEATQGWFLHLVFAAFLLSNLCRLQYLAQPEEAAAPAAEPEVDAPVAEPEPVAPIAEPEPVAPVAEPEPVAPVAEPEPVAPVAEPEPVAPIAEPEPVAPVAEPEPVAPVAEPEPVAPVAEPEPVAPVTEPELPPIPFPDVDHPQKKAPRTPAPTPKDAGENDIFLMPPPTPRPGLQTKADPEVDMDAFLQDLKQFLESENY